MYEKRDAAYECWAKEDRPFATMREAFNAGWQARKVEDYKLILDRRHRNKDTQ